MDAHTALSLISSGIAMLLFFHALHRAIVGDRAAPPPAAGRPDRWRPARLVFGTGVVLALLALTATAHVLGALDPR